MPKKALALDVVFLGRDADFRLGEFVRCDVARGGDPRKGSILGKPYSHRKIFFPGNLDLFQSDVFAGKRSHVAEAVALARAGGAFSSGRYITDFSEPIDACFSVR